MTAHRKSSEIVDAELQERQAKLDHVEAILATGEQGYKLGLRFEALVDQIKYLTEARDELRDLEGVRYDAPETKEQAIYNGHNRGDARRIMQVFRTRQAKWKQEDKRSKREIGV